MASELQSRVITNHLAGQGKLYLMTKKKLIYGGEKIEKIHTLAKEHGHRQFK